MDRWVGKVALVTGAGSGIGTAVSTALVENGMIVVGADKFENRLQDVASKLKGKRGTFHSIKADLRDENDISNTFAWIEKNLGGIHVLINNAGLIGRVQSVEDNDVKEWKDVLDVNVLALTICARLAIKSMKKHNIDDGNIINIASTASFMSRPLPGYVVYTASKKAVRTITEGMRIESALNNSNIKFTSICPGIVNTLLYKEGGSDIPPGTPYLSPDDIAQSIVFCLQLPPTAQITDLHIQPTREDLSKFTDS